MDLPDVLIDIVEDYLFPSFTKPLIEIEKITLPPIESDAAKKGFEMGIRGDVQELTETYEQLPDGELTQEDIDLITGIIMGIATAGHNFDIYDMFSDLIDNLHEEAAYQARLHGRDLAGDIATQYWRLVDMDRIEDNILLYGSMAEAMDVVRNTDPDDERMEKDLLIALQRGNRKLFDFAKQRATLHTRVQAISILTGKDIPEDEILRAISIISL